MHLTGRGQFEGHLTTTATGVLIRVDSARDDAFWLEVGLTVVELETALAAARKLSAAAVPGYPQDVLEMVDDDRR